MRLIVLLSCCVVLIACGGRSQLMGSGFRYDGDWHSQEFSVEGESRNKLDILLVIDSSSSMQTARTALSGKLNALLDSISDRDWKIAIATTEIRDCLRAIITPEDNHAKFAETIDAIGNESSNNEEAIKVIIRALRGVPVYQGGSCANDSQPVTWRRKAKESALAVIVVTDEDHQCDKSSPNDQCELQELYDLLKIMDYVPRVTAKIYGFLNTDDSTKWKEWKDKAGEPIFASIAEHDSSAEEYERILKGISIGLDGIYQSRFTLKHKHDGIKAEVLITLDDDTTETLNADSYGFAGKDLVIISALPTNTKQITVHYSYASS